MPRVLVVDDDELTRLTFSEILRQHHFVALDAPDGRTAIKTFQEEMPDAVLLDLEMPGMNGVETMKELKRINADVPVIVVTGHSDIPTVVEAIRSGAYDFIVKPPDYRMLMLVLDRAVAQLALKRRTAAVETRLRVTEAKFRTLVEQIPALTYSASLGDAVCLSYVSPQVELLLGYSSAEWLADPDMRLRQIHPADRNRVIAEMGGNKTGREPFHSEYRMFSRDGRMIWMRDEASIVTDESGRPLLLQGVMFDITEIKRAEEKTKRLAEELEQRVNERTQQLEIVNEDLRREIEVRMQTEEALRQANRKLETALEEKGVLMGEIHHRVKNNMQIIISLLRLQSGYIEDREIAELVNESQNRIRAMALIHEKFYQSRDFTHINYGDYITDLTKALMTSYASSRTIALRLDVDDVALGIEIAMHLGLIINELITNSLTHAFPDERSGGIWVALKGTEAEAGQTGYELTVGDNGVGMPKDLDFRKTKTLGLRLVTNLVEHQIGGSIELHGTKGTEFAIRFTEG